jgi:probable rRNA maturation factor
LAIHFHSEGTKFILKNKRQLKKWIAVTVLEERKITGEINIIFVNDEYILHLNQNYLKHNTYTDIITFDYSNNQLLSGDIFISLDRVKENASRYKKTFTDELNRIMVHGILHLCGYVDKSSSDKLIMRQKEEKYLSLRPF